MPTPGSHKIFTLSFSCTQIFFYCSSSMAFLNVCTISQTVLAITIIQYPPQTHTHMHALITVNTQMLPKLFTYLLMLMEPSLTIWAEFLTNLL